MEEGIKARIVTKPDEPSRKEWDDHMVTHLPYRSWCPFCVKARHKEDELMEMESEEASSKDSSFSWQGAP